MHRAALADELHADFVNTPATCHDLPPAADEDRIAIGTVS
jgi:hypothetical protein